MREREKFFGFFKNGGNGKDGENENKKFSIGEKLEKAFKESLKEFSAGDLIIGEIKEGANEVYFEFKGGGGEIFEKVKKIYENYTSAEGISPELKENFGIELDGDKKCFRVTFSVPERKENLKKEAREILELIKFEILKREEKEN